MIEEELKKRIHKLLNDDIVFDVDIIRGIIVSLIYLVDDSDLYKKLAIEEGGLSNKHRFDVSWIRDFCKRINLTNEQTKKCLRQKPSPSYKFDMDWKKWKLDREERIRNRKQTIPGCLDLLSQSAREVHENKQAKYSTTNKAVSPNSVVLVSPPKQPFEPNKACLGTTLFEFDMSLLGGQEGDLNVLLDNVMSEMKCEGGVKTEGAIDVLKSTEVVETSERRVLRLKKRQLNGTRKKILNLVDVVESVKINQSVESIGETLVDSSLEIIHDNAISIVNSHGTLVNVDDVHELETTRSPDGFLASIIFSSKFFQILC